MTIALLAEDEVNGRTVTAAEIAALPTQGALLWDVAVEAEDYADAAEELAAHLHRLHVSLDAGPDAVRNARRSIALDVLELSDALRAFAIRVVSE